MDKRKILILAAPYIGDSIFIWSVANRLALSGKSVVFVTYFQKLFQTINESDDITVLNVLSKKWKSCINSNLVISNHEAKKTKLGYIPEPLINIRYGSYTLLDLHSKQKLDRTSRLENYPDLMWRMVMKTVGINVFDNSFNKKGQISLKKEPTEQKYPWMSKPYTLIISGVSSPSRKYSGWENVSKSIEQAYGINVIIADDSAEHNGSTSQRQFFDLDEFPLLFGHPNCRMVLSSNTGLGHLAIWMQKDTAMIFSISDPTFWTSGSKYLHPIVGAKNEKHIKKIQQEDIRLDPPEVRGDGSLTKEGFGTGLTTEKEILEVVNSILKMELQVSK